MLNFLFTLSLQPIILDEYSDPFDVKKDIELTSKDDKTSAVDAQSVNATEEAPQASEDDYSVPYELKNLVGGKVTQTFWAWY